MHLLKDEERNVPGMTAHSVLRQIQRGRTKQHAQPPKEFYKCCVCSRDTPHLVTINRNFQSQENQTPQIALHEKSTDMHKPTARIRLLLCNAVQLQSSLNSSSAKPTFEGIQDDLLQRMQKHQSSHMKSWVVVTKMSFFQISQQPQS